MQRFLIVTSATYRQSSKVTKELHDKDPENRLLACPTCCGSTPSLSAIRQLAVSGLLSPEIGGASVSPYQPPGLWEELASTLDGANWTAQTYKQSKGTDLYKRTMYTFWKRTWSYPPPTLVAVLTLSTARVCTRPPARAQQYAACRHWC